MDCILSVATTPFNEKVKLATFCCNKFKPDGITEFRDPLVDPNSVDDPNSVVVPDPVSVLEDKPYAQDLEVGCISVI